MSNYYAYDLDSFRYISHYGVLGMKWGIRRYQNKDGSLTAEGRSRAAKEYKADNRIAFNLGKMATIDARASQYANVTLDKAQRRYDKKPSVRKANALIEAKALQKKFENRSKESQKAVQDHHKALIKKYGKDAISDIKYDNQERVNERVRTGKQIALDIIASGLGTAAINVLTPIYGVYISYPYSKDNLGQIEYREERKRYRSKK